MRSNTITTTDTSRGYNLHIDYFLYSSIEVGVSTLFYMYDNYTSLFAEVEEPSRNRGFLIVDIPAPGPGPAPAIAPSGLGRLMLSVARDKVEEEDDLFGACAADSTSLFVALVAPTDAELSIRNIPAPFPATVDLSDSF